jgi:8-oxo-dGTP pyrophosphatase MutT (NUDIX family)
MSDYTIKNPLVTEEDIKDHIGIGAVIRRINRFLLFYHEKYQFWTIPVGKGDLNEPADEIMEQELYEELGITVISFTILKQFKKRYYRGNNIYTNLKCYLFEINSFTGDIINKEPNKHPKMKWLTLKEIKNLKPLSDFTIAAMPYMK